MSTPVRKRAQHIVCFHSRSLGQYIHVILDRPGDFIALFILCFATSFYQMYGFCSKPIHKSTGEFDIFVEKGPRTRQNRYIFHIYFYVQHKHCKTSHFKKKKRFSKTEILLSAATAFLFTQKQKQLGETIHTNYRVTHSFQHIQSTTRTEMNHCTLI